MPLRSLALLVGGLGLVGATAQAQDPLSIDNLLSVRSVLSGRDAPLWSPDGSRILFMSGLRGGLNLMAMSPEGGFPELLTEDLGLVGTGSPGSQKPSWSPDGKWVGYVSSKGGAPEIWLWSVEDGRDLTSSRGSGVASMHCSGHPTAPASSSRTIATEARTSTPSPSPAESSPG